jgi:hypothetical protein
MAMSGLPRIRDQPIRRKLFQSIFKSSNRSPLPDNLLKFMRRQPSNEIIGATRAGAFSYDPVTGESKKLLFPAIPPSFLGE